MSRSEKLLSDNKQSKKVPKSGNKTSASINRNLSNYQFITGKQP